VGERAVCPAPRDRVEAADDRKWQGSRPEGGDAAAGRRLLATRHE
jgi:hypothetical protein